MNIKQHLYKHCQEFVNQKLETVQKTIQSNKEALSSETKSSAGDKHETGRAMLQLEMEKAGQQLKVVQQMQTQISKIDVNSKNSIGCLGSLITTNSNNYYLAISIGKVTVDSEDYFVISPNSPIGKLLLGKVKNQEIHFNGNQYIIDTIL
ncbi:MAG: 3-oxoacyl-ACP synthase [Urechidicola sp.]|nr:3-oxoacyl-ACP synthase [Urechidicola sp.]